MAILSLPAPLRRGDRVRIPCPASALTEQDRLQDGMALLRQWGLQVTVPAGQWQRRWGDLAGSDRERLADFQVAEGEEPRLWACARGGWGSARLLEQGLTAPQGWLLGFSDVTSLLWAKTAAGSGGAVHGPLITSLASEPAWSQERLRQLLFGEALPPLRGQGLRGGHVTGPLMAANLTVATHLLGSTHLPPLAGAVLVLEDVGEASYRLDRLLTHWRLLGLLQRLGGIGLGRFSPCDGPDAAAEQRGIRQVLEERCGDLGIPLVTDLPIGHGAGGNGALPLSVPARLDGDSGLLCLAS